MTILFLDDDETRHFYAERELIGHLVHHVRTVDEAIKALSEHSFDVTMLDHDLGGTHYAPSNEVSGYEVARAISKGESRAGFVVVHSYNAPGAARMIAVMVNAGVPCVWAPFGPGAFRLARENAA